ncbi:WASH complex subunit 3 isoform X2 [Anthonomus grandis grandis]|uniref:WASH complex subunit 3 isoform X2 n=1 Tax=Anthonomus grandis grandis TaxID=2921223 RepID=UPI0021651F03|nr:WASH complex subunit 3 isoform X2 [Anthonomus grandis grandis]
MDEHSHVKADVEMDLTEIPPIQQKRIITFVNHFIMTTVTYLNKFCQSCESRFMEFEYKMQKVEASLLILEAQLASIPDAELQSINDKSNIVKDSVKSEVKPDPEPLLEENKAQEVQEPVGVKACEHPIYARFFKMVRVGIREPAVKLQMQVEGHDPAILDNPDGIIS